jgi:gluconate 2-dehydrogenase alpha chain
VTYFDVAGRETFQPADLVLLCAFQVHNVRLMLVSGIGQPYDPATAQGSIGKNFAYQTMAYVYPFFADKRMNAYAGAGAMGMTIDEFNADNFDHRPHGFIGGGYILAQTTGARPIQQTVLPDGTPSWGSEWKRALHDWYDRSFTLQAHGGSTAKRDNYIDLDPTYRDAYGMPLARLTFDFPQNDLKMRRFLTEKVTEIARAMNPTQIKISLPPVPFSIVPYQTTHITGGAITGISRDQSAVNTYLQSWDVTNVFVHGASCFPQNAGYNPTNTIAAMTYRSSEAMKSRYFNNPGALM